MPRAQTNGHRPHLMRPEDAHLLRGVFDPQISPDGAQVAYVVRGSDAEKDAATMSIWVAPFDGHEPARRFTYGERDHSPRWSPDGRCLAFLSDRGSKAQVYLAPLDGGEARQLTKVPHGVNEFAWSPDASRIVYVARTGEWKDAKNRKGAERAAPRVIRNLRYRFDTIGYFDDRRMHLFVIGADGGEAKQITDGDWYDQQPAWSPDGRSIAFSSDRERGRHDREGRADIWLVPADGGRARKLTRSRGNSLSPQFSPDGRSVAYGGHEHGDADFFRNTHIMLVPADGRSAPRSVSERIDNTIAAGGGRAFTWAPDGKSLFFLVQERGTQALYRARTSSGVAARVLDGERQVQQIALGRDGARIAFVAAWTAQPSELYTTTLGAGGRERNISHANDELLAAADVGRSKRMTHRAADGVEIESFVLYPPGYAAGRRYPAVLFIHGGPHGMHPSVGFQIRAQALAAAGYIVLMPNPRGSSGYGERFTGMCVRDWGGKDYLDLMGSVDALVRKGVADPERLYVTGYSYGGFMTTWIVGHTDRFRAAIIGAPVADHISMFGTTDIPRLAVQEVGTAWDDVQAVWEGSPLAHLRNCTTPVMIEHHEGDLRCPIGQSEEIFQVLRMMGKEVEFVRYPGGFHNAEFFAPSQQSDYLRRQRAWFDTHGGASKPAGAKPAPARRTKKSRAPNGARRAPSRRPAAAR